MSTAALVAAITEALEAAAQATYDRADGTTIEIHVNQVAAAVGRVLRECQP